MSLNNPVLSEGYVPAYQMSAVPFVTRSDMVSGDIHEITFPQVSRSFNIRNVSNGATDKIAVAFTRRGFTTGNFFTLDKGVSFQDEYRAVSLFISNSFGTPTYEVVAGLTNIPSSQFLTVTASNGYSGVG